MAGDSDSRRRTCRIVTAVCCIIIVLIVVAVLLRLYVGVTFKRTFTTRCEQFTDKNPSFSYNCINLWSLFEQAYVGKDPCTVTEDAYDPLISAAPANVACNSVMFWSKSKVMVHEFTKSITCYSTIEDILLGFVLDGLTWCGEKGSNKTLTTGCPGWSQCENSPQRSFWTRLSAAFADAACGEVHVMLNGSIDTPFDRNSVFATVEVKRLLYPRVKSLNVVLVTPDNGGTNCDNASLKDLQSELAQNIKYYCKQVTESNLRSCIASSYGLCKTCW